MAHPQHRPGAVAGQHRARAHAGASHTHTHTLTTCLTRGQGADLAAPAFVPAPSLQPGEDADVSVPLVAPDQPGGYSASWRLGYMNGAMPIMFGDEIWACVRHCTAQLTRTGGDCRG